ncbi:MAG: bifunctional riboflavin kinase/FAD synthetase [Lachnospiraceae bacterium]|nr:bifunctional riboflavin kinase/FAD synthetase [Lachnospiraceae bacterium]
MKIYKEIPKLKEDTVISIGKFDGVHIGHATLLEELVLMSDLEDATSVAITFNPFPEEFFQKKSLPHLNTRGEIISEMDEIGVDILVELPFDEEISSYSPERFVKEILINKLHMKALVCGSDVSFGKDGKGNAKEVEKLSEKYGFNTEIIDKVLYNDNAVSSSRIIKCLQDGQMEDASEMLGYDYYLYGPVVKGAGVAHKFNTPTVNINVPQGRIIPKNGVYMTIVEVDDTDTYHAVSNVGVRPTVSDEGMVNVESHLIDCPVDSDLYGKRIRVYFLKYIREEKKFADVAELFSQIENDIEGTKAFFGI